jgi:hypothetical protein
MGQSIISLNLQNNTTLVQPISVFNPLPQPTPTESGNAPQNNYTYNIQNELSLALTNNFNYLTVIYSINGGAYQNTTINYGSVISSTQAFVNVLNSLNQATFYVSGTYTISCYSVAPNGNNYYYSSISANANYTTNSFVGSNTYGIYGSLIYNSGYSLNGVGTVTRINTSNAFWINSIPNTTSGRFNNCGIWSANIPNPLFSTNGVGIYANINSATNKTVYIGLSCVISSTNGILQLYVNNTQILATDTTSMRTSINSQIGVFSLHPIYQFWNIYPINLITGNNYILVNNAGNNPISGVGFQVYDNTAAQIAAATSYVGLNVLFDSANYTGNMI